jgi:hypothetical protein
MKAQTGCKVIPTLFNLGGRWGWVFNAKPRPFYPREREWVPIVRRVDGPLGRFERVRKISHPP